MIGVFSIRRGKPAVSDRDFAQLLERAQHAQGSRCACCNIGIPTGVGFIVVDGNAENVSAENLRAACKVCEAMHNGGRLNAVARCGSLIYLPDINQIEVIQLAHAMKGIQRTMNAAVITVVAGLRAEEISQLKKPAEKYLGMSDTDALADFFKAMRPEVYARRKDGLGPIRWWPDLESDQFSGYLSAYRESMATEADLKLISRKL